VRDICGGAIMPEIDVCLFDLFYLFKLFPKAEKKYRFCDYEADTKKCMAQIRLNLFGNEKEIQILNA
jgi:hypothetical protein